MSFSFLPFKWKKGGRSRPSLCIWRGCYFYAEKKNSRSGGQSESMYYLILLTSKVGFKDQIRLDYLFCSSQTNRLGCIAYIKEYSCIMCDTEILVGNIFRLAGGVNFSGQLLYKREKKEEEK